MLLVLRADNSRVTASIPDNISWRQCWLKAPPLDQNLRRVCWSTLEQCFHWLDQKLTLPFNLLTKYITIPRGTLVSRYTQLYLAFIATTLLHHSGAMNITSSSSENNLNQVAFFMLQPVAITFEDFVIYLGKKAGVKESRKILVSTYSYLETNHGVWRIDKSCWKSVDICMVHIYLEIRICFLCQRRYALSKRLAKCHQGDFGIDQTIFWRAWIERTISRR
jgi:hypothetical protein